MSRRRRGRRRAMDAQAVIETALVIPILLALIAVFLGIMVQVEVQQEMESATKLAAESFFQAPRSAVDSPGTKCCPRAPGGSGASLDTTGMPKGCRFAAETFYGTLTFRQYLTFPGDGDAAARPLCRRSGAALGTARGSYVTCDIDAVDRTLNPPLGLTVVRCQSSATLDFSRTPLAWALPWNPTITATAEAIPPPFRQ